jgi:hypothetical protein
MVRTGTMKRSPSAEATLEMRPPWPSDYPDKAAKPRIHHTLSSFAGMLGGFAP